MPLVMRSFSAYRRSLRPGRRRCRGLLHERMPATLGARRCSARSIGLHTKVQGAETVLAGELPEQAALYGVLALSRTSAWSCSKSAARAAEARQAQVDERMLARRLSDRDTE